MVPPASTARLSLPDRYRVVRHLANGGMASVWEAHDELLDRSVAVKVLAPHLGADDRARRRFEREARAAAGLSSHPNVVTIYDVGEYDDQVFMVMELMRGGSVADRLKSGREIPLETALDWLHEAAAGLDAAHEAGVVHRDIKPPNLLLDERERLAIGDFGIARIAMEDQLTATGQVLGTASYISPEQAVGEPAVAASDRYSLAVVAYELLTGSRPFKGEHFAAQARAHVEDEPDPPSERRPDLPRAVDPVLLRGLAKEPEARWPTAAQMIDRLEDALEDGPPTATTRRIAATVAPPPPPPPTRTPRTTAGGPPAGRRSNAGAVLAAGLAAVLLLAVLGVVLLSGGGSDDNDGTPTTKPKAKATATPAKHRKTPTPTPTAQSTPTPTATPSPTATPTAPSGTIDLATARRLQAAGFAARSSGDYQRDIALSSQALGACRDQKPLDPCGYAMYELGVSLLRTGHASEAIPWLQRRLAYGDTNNHEVSRTLAEAEREAGGGKAKGKNKDEKD